MTPEFQHLAGQALVFFAGLSGTALIVYVMGKFM